ncbi:TPA: winged helix-turn-helix transcriptional regulator [archaeon]|nr:winged helix-turn-helix transcriptional regulator [Candidatus Naiadarchaeales archaeon SRR2090153.bin461]
MDDDKDKKLIITPLDESAEEIGEILSSETCRKILNLLADAPLNSKQISEKLSVPLTTVEYNIDKLEKAGLIKIHHKELSARGKAMRFYAPAEKYILIAPKQKSPEKIMKSLRMLLIPALAILIITAGMFSFYSGPENSKTAGNGAGLEIDTDLRMPVLPTDGGEQITEKTSEPETPINGPTAGTPSDGGATVATSIPGNYTNNTTNGEVN